MTDDDGLRARLRAADPAASLAPAGSDRVRELLEATMSHHPSDDLRTDGPQVPAWWRRWPTLVAAVAVLVLGGVAVAAVVGDAPDPTGAVSAGDQPSTTTSSPAPAEDPAPGDDETDLTALSLSADAPPPGARCRMVTVEALATMETAFAGTVRSVDEDTVTFDVDRWYAGGDIDVVEVLNPPGLGAMVEGAPDLQPGQRFLVTAFDGQVTGCGFTAPWSERLAGMFERAFA